MKTKNRIISFLLATIMLITFALPVSAMEVDPVQDVIDMTGGTEIAIGGEDTPPVQTEPESADANAPPAGPDTLSANNEESDTSDESEESDIGAGNDVQTATENPTLGYSTPGTTESGNFLLDCTPEQAAELIAFYEFIKEQIAKRPGIQLFSAPGDSGTVTWQWGEAVGIDVPSGDPGNPYHIGNIPRITLNTANPPIGRPFCVQFGVDPGGSYTASKGSNNQVLSLLVAHQKGSASAVGVQLALWYIENGLPLSGQPQVASALSAASSVDTTGYTYYIWSSGSGQPFVTLDNEDMVDPPPVIDPPPTDEEENPNTRTEVTTETSTRTEVRSSTTYEYSDSIGQITVAKRDNEGKSLDGAIFNIQIEFANGERGGDSAFEVYNGSRLFTYTHPRDDNRPAKITVTEVRSPDGYIGDPTPKTATVHPTYTRITKVLTHTITITTTTTTTSVIDIDSGEVLAESSASADAETELNPPVVQEYVDFVEGDREMTLTFVNQPKPCSLTIYKYSKGNYSQALSGAKFRIRYADPNVSAQVWTLTTGSDGKIVIDLPHEGTLIVEELEAPANHVIGAASMWEAVVAKGEHKRLDISNDKKADIIVYKKDAQTGQLLAGATIKATLLRAHTPPYNQNVSYTGTTDADGRVVFSNVIPGEYRIEEQAPPQFYLGTSVVHNVSVFDGSNEPVTVTFENDPWTGLTIKKVDATDGRGLQGAVFKLYGGTAADPSAFLGDFISNENGLVVIQNLESNKYYTIVEAQAPYGYFVDDQYNVQTILIKPEAIDKNMSVVFRNMPKPKLLITKIDEATGARLPGAVFRVAERGSAEYVEVTTGADGTVLLDNMQECWYQVTEIRSPSGYLLDSTVHDIELIASETAKLVVNNSRQPTLVIEKIDEKTGLPLSGAVFRVAPRDGGEYVEVTTDKQGAAVVNGLTDEWYTVTEIRSPSGYLLNDTPQTVQLVPGKTTTLKISNYKKPSLTIKKIDEQTGAGLSGVVLRVTKSGAMEYQDITTGADGTVVINDMDAGWVTVVEQNAKDGYILDQTPHHIQLKPGENAEIIITNKHKPSLKIVKLDSVTKQPLQYVTFDIAVKNGAPVGSYTTDENGEIYLENINPDTYVITERPFDGYIALTSEKEVIVEWGKVTTVEFLNQPKNPLLIKKIDAKTGEPLAGAVFTVTKVNGEMVGEYTTGRNGYITVTGLLPGFFTVRETKSPEGYILDSAPKTVELKLNQPAEVTFENKPLNGIQIHKIDAQTREPLEGVKFVVREKGGRVIGEYTTNANGLIDVQGLEPGWFQVYESAALPGYLLDSNVRDVEFTWNGHILLEFSNTKLSGLQVRKLDSVTKEPLQGVKFRVTKMDGTYVGDYTTNAGGYFAVSDLEPDWYTAYETATIAGYVLDATPQNIQIKKGELAVLEFTNKPLNGLQIKKTDSVTGEPLKGVEFKVTELSGALIGTYTTDSAGLVFVPDLKEGWLTVTETRGLSGYKPDYAPRNVEIKTGKLNVVEYRNQPYPHLIVQKIDADTKQPLEGVRFKLMDKYSREIGIFTTNAQGQIHLTGMDEGEYSLQEYEAKPGYVLDATARKISLQWGKNTTVEVKNTPMGSLRIKKVDAVTGKPIPGTTFIVYDAKNNIIGEYVSDDKGVVELPRSLAAQKLKVKESKAAPGYVLDEQVRTIEIKAGETTEIVWENQPMRGKIQIVKKAAAENPITKDKSGATLAGAVFEVYDKNLNIVDTITTDKNGVATTIDLPLDTYGVKETKAPDFYFTDGNVFYGELKIHSDLIRFEVLNNPADISVTVEKRGNAEVIAGDEMRYDFSEISNTSNIPLSDFYWHDKLPADAVRLKTIFTGTWNESLTYSVTYKTNLKSGYKTLAANLTSKQNHTLDASPAALKLAAGEYVTDIRFNFGTVKAGFREDEAPSFVVTTLSTLPDGHRIVNHTDVSGTTGGKTVTAQDMWITVALGKPKGCLPRTGY